MLIVFLLLLLPFRPESQRSQALLVLYGLLLAVLAASTAILYWRARSGGERLIAGMVRALPADLVCVAGFSYLLDRPGDAFYPVAILLPVVFALHLNRKDAVWAIAFASAAAYAVGHTLSHAGDLASYPAFAVKTLAIPVVTGVVLVAAERTREHERRMLEVAAEREQAVGQMNRRVSELQAVSQITEIVHSSLDFERVGPVVLEILAKVIGVETCSLFVIDKEKSETLFSVNIGMPEVSSYESWDGLDYGALDSHFSCTAIFDHADVMVLLCMSANDVESLSDDDRLVLGAVASELVVAVENSRLYRLTKKLAITDELTGLANYRHLQTRLDDEVERARRYDKRLSLMMMDVDDFKGFNDAHGHLAGDGALAELARVFEGAIREVDMVARYGGEEFAVVLPETDAPGAYVAAEKLREAVAEHLFVDADGERDCSLTISIGIATFPDHASDKESLLRLADDALYRAKSGGKNRVKTPMGSGIPQDEAAASGTDAMGD